MGKQYKQVAPSISTINSLHHTRMMPRERMCNRFFSSKTSQSRHTPEHLKFTKMINTQLEGVLFKTSFRLHGITVECHMVNQQADILLRTETLLCKCPSLCLQQSNIPLSSLMIRRLLRQGESGYDANILIISPRFEAVTLSSLLSVVTIPQSHCATNL